MKTFEELGLNESLLKVISESGFASPTSIQEEAIPLVLEGKDVIGESATGSGKTLVFGSGIIQKLKKQRLVQALILAPTRELAEQISADLKKFSKYNPLEIISVYGGVDIQNQIRNIKNADVVVGTPGRILDHLFRRTLNLNNVKILVLDEADRMLDMGFHDDVEKILHACNRKRQTLLFSATISSDILDIAKRYMIKPVDVSVENYIDSGKLKQFYYDVQTNKKFSLLLHLLKNEKSNLVMVFCNTRRTVDFASKMLSSNGIEAVAIHGGLRQNKRNSIMRDFHKGEVLVLVCTDVAARGLDIKNVSHIYNYDLPKTSKEYIHRVGRTARAGEEGIAISLVSQLDYDNFRQITNDSSLDIKEEKLPEFREIYIRPLHRFRKFGRRNFSSRRRFRH